jgi:hypothetical protein
VRSGPRRRADLGANKWHCLACLAWKRGGMWGSDMLLRAFSGLIIARATKFAAGGQSKSTFGLPSEYPGEVTTDASRQAACAYRSNRWINLTLHFSIEPVHTAGQAWRRHSAEHGAASWWPHQPPGRSSEVSVTVQIKVRHVDTHAHRQSPDRHGNDIRHCELSTMRLICGDRIKARAS